MPSIAYPFIEESFRSTFIDHVASLYTDSSIETLSGLITLPRSDWFFDVRFLQNEPTIPTFLLLRLYQRKQKSFKTSYESGEPCFLHRWKMKRSLYLKTPIAGNIGKATRESLQTWGNLGLLIASKKNAMELDGICRQSVQAIPETRTENAHLVTLGTYSATLEFKFPTEIHD